MFFIYLHSFVLTGSRVGWETVALLHYGERHRTIRKHIHQVIGTRSALSRFNSSIEVESRRLLLRILRDPSKLLQHVHRYNHTLDKRGIFTRNANAAFILGQLQL